MVLNWLSAGPVLCSITGPQYNMHLTVRLGKCDSQAKGITHVQTLGTQRQGEKHPCSARSPRIVRKGASLTSVIGTKQRSFNYGDNCVTESTNSVLHLILTASGSRWVWNAKKSLMRRIPPPPKKWLGYDRKTITIRYEFLLRMEDFHVFFISLVNSVQMFLLIVWCIHLTSD